MNAKTIKPILKISIENNWPVLLVGKPGVGKTDLVKEVAGEFANADFDITHPVISDPTDYKGVPSAHGEVAKFLPFEFLNGLIQASRLTIVLIDDLGQAPMAVQAAIMQVVLERRIGEHKISDNVRFIACTNSRKDKAGVSGLILPLVNRFTVIDFDAELQAWIEWALKNEVCAELIAFLRNRPALFNHYVPKNDIANFPSPRALKRLSDWYKAGVKDLDVFTGCVGSEFATEFYSFLSIYEKVKDIIPAILKNPDGAPVPSEASLLYAVASGLAWYAKDNNFGSFIQYSNRMPKEFQTLFIQDAIRRTPSVAETKGYVDWINTNPTFAKASI